jgi:hypothetical protein
MSTDGNNDANRCSATTARGLRCSFDAGYGKICHRHARMICACAGNSYRWQKVKRTALRGLSLEEAEESARLYLAAGRGVDAPNQPIAFSEAVLIRLRKDGGWVPLDTISDWLTEWSGKREVNNRQTGMAIRPLSIRGLIERKYTTDGDQRSVTLWRYVAITMQTESLPLSTRE